MRSEFLRKNAFVAFVALPLFSGCQPVQEQQVVETKTPHTEYQITEDSSVSSNVQLLEDTFTFPGDISRRVWVYVPPDYAQSSNRYPVVYMHDGQNVFSHQTSYAGEWGVDETLDYIASQGESVPIVVAIDHGGEARMQELSPWTNPKFGEAAGDAYLTFLINEVKPYIDKHYRTLSSVRHTAIMGSSMGGLMTHYAIVKHPEVFSRAAVFSPSFWFSQNAFTFTETHPVPDTHKLYFNVGQKEGREMTDGMTAMVNLHLAQQHPDHAVFAKVVNGQEHNEAFWRSEVEPALRWLDMLSTHTEEPAGAR